MIFKNYCMSENDEITDVEIYQRLDQVRCALEAYNTAGSIYVDTRKFDKLKDYGVEDIVRVMITEESFYIYAGLVGSEMNLFIKDSDIMYVFIDAMIFKLYRGKIIGWVHTYCNSPLDDEAVETIEIALDSLAFNSNATDNFNRIIQILDSVEFEEVES